MALVYQIVAMGPLILWLVAAGLWFQYDGTRPSSPRAQDGRIYALTTHGHVVYLTSVEYATLYGLGAIGFAGVLAALGLGRKFKV